MSAKAAVRSPSSDPSVTEQHMVLLLLPPPTIATRQRPTQRAGGTSQKPSGRLVKGRHPSLYHASLILLRRRRFPGQDMIRWERCLHAICCWWNDHACRLRITYVLWLQSERNREPTESGIPLSGRTGPADLLQNSNFAVSLLILRTTPPAMQYHCAFGNFDHLVRLWRFGPKHCTLNRCFVDSLLFWHYPKIYIFGYSSIALLDPRSSMIADQIDTSDGSRKSFSNQIPVCLDYLFLYSIKWAGHEFFQNRASW